MVATGPKPTSSMTQQGAEAKAAPIIVTAHVRPEDMIEFNAMRREHFPPERNFLDAHITMFHHMPSKHLDEIVERAKVSFKDRSVFTAQIRGVRHLGAGVAFEIASEALEDVRTDLFRRFGSWPGPQDRQKFKPHITVQNKVSRAKADELFKALQSTFEPKDILIEGIDLWFYRGGPWQHVSFLSFAGQT